MISKCPKCGSEDTGKKEYMGVSCLFCRKCGYDESLELDSVPGSRGSQKAKSGFSPYKAGGHSRALKRHR